MTFFESARRGVWLGAALLAAGCGSPEENATPAGDATTEAPAEAPAEETSAAPAPHSAPRAALPLLSPDERRAALFVVPGDALVEVDGQLAARRNGVVELVGKVGDVRRVRVFKGAKSTEEKLVTIQEAGAVPAFLDLNEPSPRAKAGSTKGKPVRFSFDE